jgi:hypothetical protein
LYGVEEFLRDAVGAFKVVQGARGRQARMTCPEPACAKPRHFYVSLDTGLSICHRCGAAYNFVGLVRALFPNLSWRACREKAVEYAQETFVGWGGFRDLYTEFMRVTDRGSALDISLERAYFPHEAVPLFKVSPAHRGLVYEPLRYLAGRRIALSRDVEKWSLHYAPSGTFARRVLFPVYRDGVLVFYTGRAIDGDADIRYRVSYGAQKNRVVYGIDHYEPYTDVAVVEGPLDAIRWRVSGISPVALLGKTMSAEQAVQIGRLTARYVYLVLDSKADTTDRHVAAAVATLMRYSLAFVRIVVLPEGEDPASASRNALVQAVCGAVPAPKWLCFHPNALRA